MKTPTPEAVRFAKGDTLEVPAGACSFEHERAVSFAEVTASDTSDRMSIRVLANSGEVIPNHWFWGNFAIDLEGLEIGRQDKPILLDHRSDQIVGYTSKIESTPSGVVAEGTVLAGEDESFSAGRRVKAFAEEGYPWQSSVYVPPSEVEFVPKDKFEMVNGHRLEGPGHIFRKSLLREVTVTSMGADENTDAEKFGEQRKELIVSKLTQKEPDVAEPEATEVRVQLQLDTVDGSSSLSNESDPKPEAKPKSADETSSDQLSAVEIERERVARLTAAAEPNQHALLSQLVTDGVELAEGLEQLFADHKKANTQKLSALVEDCAEELGMDGNDSSAPKLGDSPEGRARAKFRADKDLQEEFLGDEDLYIAFRETEGLQIEERN